MKVVNPGPESPYALIESGQPNTFTVTMRAHHCVGVPGQEFLFGGMGMAFAARAIAQTVPEPLHWLTVQFVAPSPLGATLTLAVERFGGERIMQLGVRATIAGKMVFTGLAAAGQRPGNPEIQALRMPVAAPPEDCPVLRPHADCDHDVHQNLDMRLAKGRFGIFSKVTVAEDGHVLVWMRPSRGEVDIAALAMMADFIPSTSSNALETRASGSSLDNTLRVIRVVPTEWVLCDIAISAIYDGIGHGRLDLFAQDGTLMAIASQSYVVRVLPARPSTPKGSPNVDRETKDGDGNG